MKERVTISVESEAIEVARNEVKAGRAASVSAAVEAALVARSRQQALREAIQLSEEEHGPIDEEAMEWAGREIERVLERQSSSMPER